MCGGTENVLLCNGAGERYNQRFCTRGNSACKVGGRRRVFQERTGHVRSRLYDLIGFSDWGEGVTSLYL
ncbi:uncharacterized protein YALI1_E28491g [Yarrowia lipolytica]|uniref:Uncharacterized protein n=1 Tax=Yarrowia lipolytica TaxID=4952 RepID=A0A1D8NJS7_YARLL|nr:hypothetical protein YALI1_E28491g [Yarrowia lipolytica]